MKDSPVFLVRRASKNFWFRFLRPLAQRVLNKFRVREGLLSVGFHHFLHNWDGLVEKLGTEQVLNPEISLVDSANSSWHQQHIFKARALWSVKDAVFDPKGGVLYLKGAAVMESHGQSAIKKVRRTRPFLVQSTSMKFRMPVIPLSQRTGNYYHWLIEELPRAISTRDTIGEHVIVLGRGQPEYVQDSLSLYGFNAIHELERTSRFENVILPARGMDSGWPHPNDIHALRSIEVPEPQKSLPRRFFIKRQGVRRPVANEGELEARLLELNIETIVLEDLGFEDQVALFSSATTVVGLHGAGLANLAFCKPTVKVFELAPVNRSIQCFETICKHIGAEYMRIPYGRFSHSQLTDEIEEEALQKLSKSLRV